MLRNLTRAFAVAALPFFAACSDTNPTAPVAPTPESSARAAIISGDQQLVSPTTDAADTLSVRFTTAAGAPIAGAVVSWTATGDGQVTALASATDADGLARAIVHAGTKAGDLEVTAIASDADAHFQLRIIAAEAAMIESMVASLDSVKAGEQFEGAPVRVTDTYGNAVAGGQVEVAVFAGDDTDAEARFTVVANGAGVARLSDLTLPAGTHRIVYTLGESTVTYTLIVTEE